MAMTRTAWIDDDGTGTTGTVINNAEKTLLYDQIDAALAGYMPVNPSGYLTRDLLWSPDATYDIGKSAANRPRDVFASRNLTAGGVLTVTGLGPHVFNAFGGGNRLQVRASTAGAGNSAAIDLGIDTNPDAGIFQAFSSTFASSGAFVASGVALRATLAGGLSLLAEGVSAAIRIYSTGTTDVVSGGTGGVRLTNGATAWAALSDERLKTDLQPLTEASQKLAQLRTLTGRYRTDADDVRRVFLIGQDVQAVLPEAVSVDAEDYVLLRYADLIPLIVAGHHEHDARITALEGRR